MNLSQTATNYANCIKEIMEGDYTSKQINEACERYGVAVKQVKRIMYNDRKRKK